MKKFILDACAVIASVADEEGADKVEDVFKQAEQGQAVVYMHKINLLEVYYGILRVQGKHTALDILAEIKQNPIQIISDIPDSLFLEAGRDSIAVGSASVFSGELITADHHELDEVEKRESVKFFWIR